MNYSGFDYALDRINSADQEIARLKAQNAMDYTPYDYALDRIGALERQVSLLRDELRAASAVVGADRRVEPASLAENGN
jgi:hypothetical protein